MMTEKMRVSASSVIKSVEEMRAIPARWRGDDVDSDRIGGECTIRPAMHSVPALRRTFAVAAVAWAAALPAAAWTAALPQPSTAAYLFSLLVYGIGSGICHQLPERSFYLWGRQLPVCARCAGIYAGAALTVIVMAAGS